ncbi:MAG: hypothetical protein ACJ768_11755 [Gaiellaceae bacterium]
MTDPTTPAAELRAAAKLVGERAAAARQDMTDNPFWHCYDPASAWRDGLVNGFGGPSSEYAALMHPGVGEPLAAWLEAVAREMRFTDGTEYQHVEFDSWKGALAVARALLGTAR